MKSRTVLFVSLGNAPSRLILEQNVWSFVLILIDKQFMWPILVNKTSRVSEVVYKDGDFAMWIVRSFVMKHDSGRVKTCTYGYQPSLKNVRVQNEQNTIFFNSYVKT